MKRSVTEDKGGIDERDKSEKEGEMRTKKKKKEFGGMHQCHQDAF
jgi:hypothetical protein